MLTVYGIKNCDTMKKAFNHLQDMDLDYDLFDFKKETPTAAKVKEWKKQLGDWPVNTRGTTYRKIKEQFESATDAQKVRLILDNLSAIKRPILEKNNKVVLLGYKKDEYQELA